VKGCGEWRSCRSAGTHTFGPYNRLQLVRINLATGQPEPLLAVPFYLSPGWLRLDPTFDVVRSHPRFERLLAGG
jgi:hypothetical protein